VVLGGFLPVEGVVRLIVRMAIGGVVYVACIRVLEGPIIEEARALMRDAKKGIRA
jgi:hypothetical protein